MGMYFVDDNRDVVLNTIDMIYKKLQRRYLN